MVDENKKNSLEYGVLSSLSLPIAIVDKDSSVRYFNDAFRIFVNLPPRKIEGEKISQLFEDRSEVQKNLDEAISQNKRIYGREINCKINNQAKIFVTRVIPTCAEDPDYLISIQDISVESQLHNKYRAKLLEIRSKTVELINVAKLAGIGEISAGLVHDIKNPISTVAAALHRLESTLDKGEEISPPKLLRYVRMAQKAADAIIRMADQVTHFSRAVPVKEFHSLDELVRNACILIENKLRKKAVFVKIDLEPDFPKIYVDGIQFEQVFMNLLGNSCDAMEIVPNKTNRIEICGSIRGDVAQISVSDNGCGIPEENLDKIFNSLYTTKADGQGTGLGLSIVRSIIKEHEGGISATSRLGEGATFTISIPHISLSSLQSA